MQLTKMKRLDIIIETASRSEILDIVKNSGATGYTLYPEVDGEGMRESREDIGFVHPHKNTGIFVIGPEPVNCEAGPFHLDGAGTGDVTIFSTRDTFDYGPMNISTTAVLREFRVEMDSGSEK